METWIKPIFDKHGMTQWYWRVTNIENFNLGNQVEIGSFTVIDAKHGVTIEDNVKIGWSCSIFSNSTIDNKQGKIIYAVSCDVVKPSTHEQIVEDWEKLIDVGIDGICTNYPLELNKFMAKKTKI